MNRRQAGRGASFVTHVRRKPWRARAYFDGKQCHLGYFSTRMEALAAHEDAVTSRLVARHDEVQRI